MIALRYKLKLWAAVGIALMCVPGGVWAQQQSQDQTPSQDQSQPQDQSQAPIPAYHPPLFSAPANDEAPQELQPDTQPLAGVQLLSLGIPVSHNYWQPSASVSSVATSNGLTGNSGWTTYMNLLGGLALHHDSGRSDLALSYQGGGVVSNDGAIANGVIQELGLVENLSWERTTLSFFEQASYVPETGFGYTGIGSQALPGGNPVTLPPGVGQSATILTTRSQQLESSTLAQINVELSPRTSLTMSGGYTLLHFFGSNLLSPSSIVFQGGYNHDLTRKDTIAVLYRFNALRFTNSSQTINDNVVQLAYARRVTGRLAFQVGAGPDISFYKFPVVTGPGSSSTASTSLLSLSVNTAVTYQMGRTLMAVSYGHGVSGGAGVFSGAIDDTVTGSVTHQVGRSMGLTLSSGYARNKALAIPFSVFVNQSYNNLFGSAVLTHPLGRAMNLTMAYEGQYQDSNTVFCIGPTCSTNLVIHQITVGLSWQGGPAVF